MISCEEQNCSSGSSYIWEQRTESVLDIPPPSSSLPSAHHPRCFLTDQYYVERFFPRSQQQIRLRYLQKLERSGLLPEKPTKKIHHMIVFDWDDTLFCTSFMSTILQGEWNRVGLWEKQKVEELDKAVEQILLISTKLAEVCIVTNSIEGWVDFCSETFMPLTHQVIQQQKISVISARQRYEGSFPNDPQKWKTQAFAHLLHHLDNQILLNLIAVGDSAYEMEAAEQASCRFEKRLLKTVRLRDKPRGEQLLKEVRLVCSRLSELFCCPKNMSIKLQPKR